MAKIFHVMNKARLNKKFWSSDRTNQGKRTNVVGKRALFLRKKDVILGN